MKSTKSFLYGLGVGCAACLLALNVGKRPTTVSAQVPRSPQSLVVRLHRFSLRPDRLPEFDQWVQFEHDHHAETVATLEREKMYAEAIFRDREHDPTSIYWLEIRDEGGGETSNSPLPIDRQYARFMQETLVPHSRLTLLPEYTLTPPFLLAAIKAHASTNR